MLYNSFPKFVSFMR